MGTFDDLSDEEKTRALLQFLQHHQQLEQENEGKQFQDSITGTSPDSAPGGSPKSAVGHSIHLTLLLTTALPIVFRYIGYFIEKTIL